MVGAAKFPPLFLWINDKNMEVIKYDIPKTSSTGNTKTSVGYTGSGDGGITLDELKEAVSHYLRKDADDVAQCIIRYMSEQKLDGGATFGNYFAGLDGTGGKIDRNGDGELNSLAIRQGLNINEASLKYDDETRALSLTDTQGSLLNFLGGIVFNKDFSINTEGVAVLKSMFALDTIVTKNLTVSGLFKVFQLVIDKVKAASGGIICTSADGFTVDVVEDNQQSLDGGIFRTSFISNPNNGYIDTGVVPTNNTRIKARVRVTRPAASSLQALYGATADNIDDYFDADYSDGDIVYTYDADKVAVSVDGESVSIVSEDLSYPYLLGMTNGESASKLLVNFGNTYDDTLDNEEGVITIEQSLSGITVGSATKVIDFAHLDVENLSKTLYLFANNGIEGADSFCHNVEILDLKIYEGEQVIRDYCPAFYSVMKPHHTPVTVYGLFDRINHEFKQSEGDAFGGSNIILPTTYTLYWRATDFSGKQRGNMWQVGDQALCQSYNNAVAGETRTASNKKYWALVTAVSDFNNPIEVTLPDGTSAPCHYISISKTDYTGTLNPEIGDDIVMLGNRTDAARQSAIYLTAYDSLDTGYTGDDETISGITAPLLAFYAGINDFNLSKHRTTFFANGENSLQGNLKIATGQSVEDYVAGELGGMNNGLLATGIDITNGKIGMIASQFTLRDNDGTERIKATNGKVTLDFDNLKVTSQGVQASNGTFDNVNIGSSSTFSGKLTTIFKNITDSDATYDSGTGRYTLHNDLVLLTGTNNIINLPTDRSYIGAHAILYDNGFPPYSRMSLDIYTTIKCNNPILMNQQHENYSDYSLKYQMIFKGGLVELVGVPYGSLCAWAVMSNSTIYTNY